MDVHVADFVVIALLVLLEGLLSADNALVLAMLVLGLPRRQQRKALRYGILGAFAFRIAAILLAVHLIQLGWVKLIGAAYLLWLSYNHFFKHQQGTDRRAIRKAAPWLGLTAFWATVVKVELTDIVFAIDSILVAVAMSNKTWVIISGGILGVVMMRLVIGTLLTLVRRYPALVDGAFVIIAWVGVKLVIEFLGSAGYIGWHVNQWFSFALILTIFGIAYLYARKQGPVPMDDDDDATELLRNEEALKPPKELTK